MNPRPLTLTALFTLLLTLALASPAISPAAVFSAGNHAPLLDAGGQPSFDPGFLNHFNPAGTQVAAMLATGANGDPITDPDLGAVEGIAVVWADNANGVWQFSTNGGFGWSDFPTQTTPSPLNLGGLGGGSGFAINGPAAADQAGWSVSRAGDVNGDGLDDIIIGANQADAGGQSDAGASYVIFGTRQPPASPLNLSALNGANGFALLGADASDFSGHAVAGAGDVNHDGYADVIIGAIHADPGHRDSAGAAYVVFGGPGFAATLDLSTLDGSTGFVLNGINAEEDSDKAGYSVSGAGDVNGDGVDDIIIGAPFADPNGEFDAGQSYLVFGSTGAFPAALDLSDLNGSNGVALNGAAQSDWSGWSVSGAGDVNGDGFGDILIGAGNADPGGRQNAGAAYLVFGRGAFAASLNLSDLDGSDGFALAGEAEWDHAGWSVSGAGDINADGRPDLLVSASEADAAAADSGKSYVIFGHNGPFSAALELGSLDGSNGFALNGVNQTDFSGQSVSGLGDLNADGVDDLLIGANLADPSGNLAAGQSYVVFGRHDPFPAALNLSDLDGGSGFALNGVSVGEEAGYSVSGAGDFDGDGRPDLLIGAPHAGPGAVNAGRSYLVFGRPLATTLTATPFDQIRFVPNPGYTGPASLLFRAWDTTDGHHSGDTGVLIGGAGGEFAYSSSLEQATIAILAAPPDLAITQTVAPAGPLQPGQTLTTTLVFSNAGAQTATGVAISSPMAAVLENLAVDSSGAPLTPGGGPNYNWSVADLAVGQGGVITITGQISPNLASDASFISAASISGSQPEAFTANNSASTTTGVILPRVYFSASSYVVDETAGSISVPARLNIPSNQTVTVDYATGNGSAAAGSDYLAAADTLTFSPGVTVQTITVTILDDFLDESSETINLTLSQPFRAIIAPPAQTALTILNNDVTITGLAAANNGPSALGAATNLAATITAGNDVAFAWDFGDGQSGSGAGVSHTYAAPGSYTAVVTATNAVNQLSATTTVVVQAPVSGLAAGNSSPVQLGQSTALTATVSGGTAVTYHWNFGDGQSGSGAGVSHTYAAVGSYVATVTASNSVSSQSTQTTVTVVDVPISGLTAGNNSPTELFKLTALSAAVTAGSNVTYQWNFGDGSSGSGASVAHDYPDVVGVYTATVTASNSVGSQSASTVVTITDVPISGLAVTGSSPKIHGQSTAFNATLSKGTNVTYTWNFGDGSSPQPGGAAMAYLYGAPGSYTVVVTAANGLGSATASTLVTVTPRTCWVRLNNSATDYFYVQDAINASTQPGDVVKVAGVCSGVTTVPSLNISLPSFTAKQLAVLTKTLTLQGGYTVTNWLAPDPVTNPTVLNALNSGRVLYITNNADPTIAGLTLTGGNADGLGGSGNGDIGGGVYVNLANPTLVGNTIAGNSADQGGGLWLLQSSALISGNVITANVATALDGGGLYVYQGAATVVSNTITANSAARYGGGAYLYQGATRFETNAVSGNSAQSGGGLYMWRNTGPVANNAITANTATSMGGGAYLNDSSGPVSRNTFSQNSADSGGGLFFYKDRSGFDGNVIRANSGVSGGGLFLSESNNTLTNNFIINNQAISFGSGVHVLSAQPTLAHTTIVGNSGGAAGIYVKSTVSKPSNARLVNNIVVDHAVGLVVELSGRADLSGTLWGSGEWANATDWAGPGVIAPGSINVWADPAFVDAPGGDYHLQPTSPAIDQGATAVAATDFDGSHRPAGGGFELGADEIPVALNVAHWSAPNPVEPGMQLNYTLMVTNVENFDIPASITFTPAPDVTPNTPQSWAVTLSGGQVWSTQLAAAVNVNAVGPLVSRLAVTSPEGDFTNNYAVGVEKAITNLAISNSSPTLLGLTTAMTATATGDNIQFAWNFGDGEIGSGPTLTHTYAAAGDYPVTVTASNGVSVVSATMTAMIEQPVAGLNVAYHSPVALGQPAWLTASVTAGNHVAYGWDFGDGQNGSGANVSHTFAVIGSHVVTATASNHVSQQAKTVLLVVQQAISGLTATSSSPTRLNQTTAFTAALAAGSNVTYNWNFGDGQTGSGPNPTHTYAAVGSYPVSVTASNGVSSQTATTTVTITDIPITGLTAGNNSPTVINQTTALAASVTAGSNVVYSWAFGDGQSGSGPAPGHKYAAVGVYTATVTASNGASTQTASTVVHVIDEAITGLTAISSSPDNLGETTSLVGWVTKGSNALYSWDFGDGQSAGGPSVNHVYASGGAFMVSLTAANSVSQQTITRTVIINRPPVALLNLSPVSGTLETVVTASAAGSSDPEGQSLTYTFDFGGERVIGPQSSPTASYRFLVGGARQVQVTVSDGQAGSTAAQTIDIETIPLLAISKTGPSQVFAGDSITYTLTITNTTLPPGSSPQAVLALSSQELNFHSTEGGSSPAGQSLAIGNSGSGELVWLARKNADWLNLSQSAGSGPAAINVGVNIDGLTPGVYQDQITIDAGLAQNGLQTVDATLTLFCTGRQPVDVMLALDKSGSMYGAPFNDARSAVQKFVGLMDLAADQVGLVSFATIATVDHTLTRNGEAVKTTVNSLSAGGLTHIAEAINDAHLELMSQRRQPGNTPVIIVLSDGTQTVAGNPIAEATQAKADGIRIISIGLGYADATVLRAIASSPGDYYYAPTSDELSLIYNRIAVEVGCPGRSASLSLSAAAEADPLAPVFRTMPAAASTDPADAATAYNLVITDTLPAGATYVSGGAKNGNVVSWAIPQLLPNTSVQVSFVVQANETAVNDIYGVSADGGFSAAGEQPVVTTIVPRPAPALSLSKTASASQVVGATDVTYTYVVQNTGTAPLSNIAIDDDKLGFVGGKESLLPGESWQTTKVGLIVEDTTNIATASATSPFGPASATASATVDFKPAWLCGATIRSVGSGDWKNASTWEPARIPKNDDIVWVQSGHTVIIQAAAQTNIQALCNYGTLRSTDQQQLHIIAHDFLHNYGVIESTNGEGGPDKTCGHPANNLKLAGSPIINWGTIQAGDGGDGEKCGGRGGSVMVMGHNTTNYGTICAGQGGDVLGTGKASSSHSGKGGDTHVWGNHGGPGMLLNTGLLCAGDGGNGNPAATGEQRGGDGGDLKIISEPDVILSGGRYYAGEGGTGSGGGRDGRDGRVFIEPVTIELGGPNTEVKGGDIIIFGGDGAVLDLSNMNGAAIEASGDIVVAVGDGGSVDFQNNGVGSDVFKAGGEVQVAADTILLDSGTSLEDVVDGEVTAGGSELLEDVSISAATQLGGPAGAPLAISLTVLNGGPADDSYTLTQENSGGWAASLLPSVAVAGLTAVDVPLTLTIPDTAGPGERQVITVTATSQSNPAATSVTLIEVEVAGAAAGDNNVYLPVVIK